MTTARAAFCHTCNTTQAVNDAGHCIFCNRDLLGGSTERHVDKPREAPGRAPYWWENLLQVWPRIVNIKGVTVLIWLGSITVLRRPKE